MFFYIKLCIFIYIIVYGVLLYILAKYSVGLHKSKFKHELFKAALANRFQVIHSKQCDDLCLASLHVIDRVKDILDSYQDNPSKGYAYIYKHFYSKNKTSNPIVYERAKQEDGTYTYNVKVYKGSHFRKDNKIELKKLCKTKVCAKEIRSKVIEAFKLTSEKKKQYMLYNLSTPPSNRKQTGVYKKSVLFRYSKNIIIENESIITNSDQTLYDLQTFIICYMIYALWILLALIVPGNLLSQCDEISTLKENPIYLFSLLIIILVPYSYLIYGHLNAVKKKTDDSLINIITILVQARYSSLGMVGLVLALGLFIEFCPQERKYVFPALFLSMFFAVPALLDFYSEYSSIAMKRRNHIRNACFIASIWSFVWLFVLLIYRSIVR